MQQLIKESDRIIWIDDDGCGKSVYPCFKYGKSGTSHVWVKGSCGTLLSLNANNFDQFSSQEEIKAFMAECNAALCGYAIEPVDPPEPLPPCIPISIELTEGTYCKDDILALVQEINPDVTDWYGWSAVVEKLGGLDIDNNAATTCCVSSEGDHGTKMLDGAGANWYIEASDTPLGEQCFTVKPGSILEFNGSYR